MQKIIHHFTNGVTTRRLIAISLGNVILGFGGAALKLSGLGNDPFTAACMALSDGFGVGLGNFQLSVNLLLLIIQLLFGRRYLGFGSLINLCLLGYITQYAGLFYGLFFPSGTVFTLWQSLIIMSIALILVTFGLSMYQVGNLGVSPYDFLPMFMTDKMPTPYFVNRMIADCICVLIIVIAVLSGFLTWQTSHLGLGTVIAAFCLGPLVNFFSAFHKKWIAA